MSKSKNNNNFLVYMYMRKDGTPYYVGKGRPRRPYDKRGRHCPTPPKERIIIYRKNLDEGTAFQIEKELIAKYGRKDIGTGILRNLSDGGEGASGYKFSRESVEKRSGKNNPRYVPRDWFHPNHGKILQKSCSELSKIFPKQKLNRSCLSSVANGKRNFYKGWRLLKNKDLNSRISSVEPKDWFHSDHGEILGTSISKLIEMFPGENLSKPLLHKVASGKKKLYRGWRLLKNKDYCLKPYRGVLRDWFHPNHGKIFGISALELIEMFPEQNLEQSCLSRVVGEKINHHRGWKLTKNKNKSFRLSGGIPRDWFHPDYGEVLQKSCTELTKMFPKQKLDRASLSKVAIGKNNLHKGWRLLKNRGVRF